jgi:hypothetical protein
MGEIINARGAYKADEMTLKMDLMTTGFEGIEWFHLFRIGSSGSVL